MKRFLRTALMSVLILLSHAVTMEQEHCMPEDHTSVAIPFRSLYGGITKFNLGNSLFLLLIHRAIYWFFYVSMSFLQKF